MRIKIKRNCAFEFLFTFVSIVCFIVFDLVHSDRAASLLRKCCSQPYRIDLSQPSCFSAPIPRHYQKPPDVFHIRYQTCAPHISPHCATTTSCTGLSSRVRTFSIFRTTSSPSTTRPNTTCFPSRCGAGAVRMKNWQPLVLGPEFYRSCQPTS